MRKLPKVSSLKAGLPPGSLLHIGDRKSDSVKVKTILFNTQEYNEIELSSLDNIQREEPSKTRWIKIIGVHDIEILKKIGTTFKIDQLILEDIVDTNQYPKIENSQHHIFIVCRFMYYDDLTKESVKEQLSILFFKDTIITFHEKENPLFNTISNNIKNNIGNIRNNSSDYLLYIILDNIVDGYFILLEKVGNQVEEIEEKVIKSPSNHTLNLIHSLKREMLFIHKSIWPMREIINCLNRDCAAYISAYTQIYFKDIYEHIVQLMDITETYRDVLSVTLDIYITNNSNKINEIMKTLTIISTIFIPLTFLVGLYGMNFEFMPELKLKYGYPCLLFIMLSISISLIFYFKKKKWIH